MANLATDYTEEYICKKFLTDANLYVNYNPHNNYFDIDLLVYKKVDNKYWKVIIICDEIYQFNMMDHGIGNTENIERCQCRPYIVLEVNINKSKISATDAGKYHNINSEDKDFDIFSIEIIGVEKIIRIICKFSEMELYELTQEEYEDLLNG
jgi:hypothetical protein